MSILFQMIWSTQIMVAGEVIGTITSAQAAMTGTETISGDEDATSDIDGTMMMMTTLTMMTNVYIFFYDTLPNL